MVSKVIGVGVLALFLTSSVALGADGESLFNGSCALCHQQGGVGSPGFAPPLADQELWTRLGGKGPAYIAGVMLAGMSGTLEVAGVKYSGLIMPPQNQMSDDQLAAIGNYVLSVLNQSKEKLLAPAVTQLRKQPLTHAGLREMRRSGS